MGNSSYKREQARLHNEIRAQQSVEKAEREADMKANPEKYKMEVYKTKVKHKFDKPPVKVSTWKELAAVVGEGDFKLRITPEKGNGWIIPKEAETEEDADFELVEYLSTHTFYGSEYKRSTKLLREHGFNVTITNWDEN